ncbi:hypothetical protein PoMZ_01698 [Pyricularia oryzae]|uniref:Uncharacterized protein n=1 Tax=Pyricularia oryzae TaxID=318829 RepID=A0A4P7N5F0_PYROR|nr:hypothetical protein PoMZ_01698 [Pyricularia oryzae]
MRKGLKSESDPEFYFINIEANVVFIDIPCNKVIFKLTSNIIDTLIKYYQDVYYINAEEKEQHKRLFKDFIEIINCYIFRIPAVIFNGLEKDGAGEPFCGQSRNVKTRIWNFIERLLPSPFKKVEPISESPSLSTAAFFANLYPKLPINKMLAFIVFNFGYISAAPKYELAPNLTYLDPTPKGISEFLYYFHLFAAPIYNPGGQF